MAVKKFLVPCAIARDVLSRRLAAQEWGCLLRHDSLLRANGRGAVVSRKARRAAD